MRYHSPLADFESLKSHSRSVRSIFPVVFHHQNCQRGAKRQVRIVDPLTHATLGAAAAALISTRGNVRLAIAVGAAAAAVPDLDVLIKSEADPLLNLQYHRHFTHALVVAPLIGLLMAWLFKIVFFWKQWPFWDLARFGIGGALTHGLLDACTSYGTSLYWPFSEYRESWEIVSVIDPLFTVPLLVLVVITLFGRRPNFARVGLLWCLAYLTFGIYQRERAEAFTQELAVSRGHVATEVTVRPSFGNTVLWRILYRYGDRYYVDAVRILPGTAPVHHPGDTVEVFTRGGARVGAGVDTTLANDIERFRHFSQGFLYIYPGDPRVVGDLRYALFPDSISPLWGIRIDGDVGEHADVVYFREASPEAFGQLWRMILGKK